MKGGVGFSRMLGAGAAALALAAVACGGGDGGAGDAPAAIVRDSAGITIVENERPAEGSRLDWTIGASPSLSIGTFEGEDAYQLYRVTDATLLPDGRVAIANRGSNEIRLFGPDGGYLEAWGAEGEGPGEFTGLGNVRRWQGDSVMAWDFGQRRITVFDAEGTLGRTIALRDSEEMTFPTFQATLPGGRIAVRGASIFTAGETPGTGLTRQDNGYAVMDAEGSIVAELGTRPGAEMYLIATPEFVSVTTHPFGRTTRVTGWGDGVVVAANDRYELLAYTSDGTLARIVRMEYEVGTPTQEDLDAHFEAQYADLDPEERRESMARMEEMPLNEAFPAWDDVKSDALGYLWVREFALPGDERILWTVYDSEGVVQGRLETPADFAIYEIGADYLLGRARDDFDVEYVQMWPLTR